jgi:MoxR-like ATPase
MTELSAEVQKFHDVEAAVNSRIVEREEEARTGVIALLAKVHHYQGGPPGIAKSLLATTFSDLIADASHYENLMTRQTKLEEIFGPISFKGLEDDRVRFNVDEFLPTADIAFLDEIFKSSSSTLNALLWILNERKYRNDGAIHESPLITMFCASNELPQGDELNALYDRIHFRHWLSPIQEGKSFHKMLKAQGSPRSEPMVTLAELKAANLAVKEIEVRDEVYKTLWSLRKELLKEGIEVSDRKFAEGLKIVKASAWYRGATEARNSDIRLLHHTLWTSLDAEERVTVEKIVTAAANPLDEEAMKLRNEVQKLSAEASEAASNKLNATMKIRQGVQLQEKLTAANADMTKLKDKMTKADVESELIPQIETSLKGLATKVLKEFFEEKESAKDLKDEADNV